MKDMLIEKLLKRAEKQAKELDYPLAVALGDIIGALVYDIDAYLVQEKESRILQTVDFQERFASHAIGFCDKINAMEILE
jgi:hypothetical protein